MKIDTDVLGSVPAIRTLGGADPSSSSACSRNGFGCPPGGLVFIAQHNFYDSEVDPFLQGVGSA